MGHTNNKKIRNAQETDPEDKDTQNGNIKALDRQGKLNMTGLDTYGMLDSLTYTYSGNRLITVEDTVADSTGRGDFYDGVGVSEEYLYDDNGNMIEDRNKGITDIQYNHLNLPQTVTFSGSDKRIEYVYDAAGIKLQQKVYDGDPNIPVKIVDYIGEFIYQDSVIQFVQHEEGRILPPDSLNGWEYQYHLKDHLGNVRLTFTSEPKVYTYLATMETENLSVEDDYFENLTNYEVNASANHTAGGDEAVALNNAHPAGPGIMLKVHPGDTVDMEAWAYYNGGSGYDNLITQSTFAAAVASVFGTPTGGGESQLIYDAVYDAVNGSAFGMGGSQGSTTPAAYINYILFDEDYNYLDGGHLGINSNANGAIARYEIPNYIVNYAGQLFVYVSNESDAADKVYFDDFKITTSDGPVVQVDDYYPFGLTISGTSSQRFDALKNRFKFQSQELQDDLDLGWYSFKWRNHDPTIGRFVSVDPLAEDYYHNSPYAFAENKVIAFIELEGLEGLHYTNANGEHIIEKNVVVLTKRTDLKPQTSSEYSDEKNAKIVRRTERKNRKNAKDNEAKLAKVRSELDLYFGNATNSDGEQVNFQFNVIGVESDNTDGESTAIGVIQFADSQGTESSEKKIDGKSSKIVPAAVITTESPGAYNSGDTKANRNIQLKRSAPSGTLAHEVGHTLLTRGKGNEHWRGGLMDKHDPSIITSKDVDKMIEDSYER